jgi:P27 family predicted phage terminase small subunit
MRGRKPLPTNLKLITGNPGKQRLPKGEPQAEICIPDPPACLDAYAMEEWARITPVLLALGLISELTMPAVVAYCDSFSDWRTATEELSKMKTEDGAAAALVSRLKVVARGAREAMVKFATEFGGTEAAKARLAIDPGRGAKGGRFSGLIGGKPVGAKTGAKQAKGS